MNAQVLATQARIRIRPLRRLAVAFGVAAVVAAVLSPTGIAWMILVALAGVAIVGAGLEWASARHAGGRSSEPRSEARNPTADFEPSPDGLWDQRHVMVGRRVVAFRVSAKKKLVDRVRAYVEQQARNGEALQASFERFKAQEASRRPQYADFVRRLELDTIDFVSPERPLMAEVSFSDDSGGEQWTCLLENGEFKDLALDN
jgi:hypothetical protein